jgi:subtilase family serine protease/ribosomal protein L40E
MIVVSLLASSFAGFLFLVNAPSAKASAGDLVVTGTYTIENMVQPIDGNVYVNAGGNLIIRNATMSIISNVGAPHTVNVNSGGTLTLDHGTITAYLDQIDPWPFLTLNVNAGTLTASGASVLEFPGSITLTAGAQVTLRDTTIDALPSDLVNQFVVGSGGAVSADSANDGPAITVTDSTFNIFDSTITDLPEYPTLGTPAANVTLAGTTNMLAVNSYIGVDFGPVLTPGDWTTHNVLALTGSARAYLYGCSFAPYSGNLADRKPSIVTSASPGSSYPATKGAADNTGGNLATLGVIDSTYYQVSSGQTMEIDTWSSVYGDSLPVTSASLSVSYYVNGYTGSNAVEWAAQGSAYQSTGIVPTASETTLVTKTYSLPMGSVRTVGDVRNLNLRFVGGTAGSVFFDQAVVTFTTGSGAFIYRWLNATVGDEYGVPIGPPIYNASVTAKFSGSSDLQGQTAFYYVPGGISTTPPVEVLSYLGQSASYYQYTQTGGVAVIPYLSDVIIGGMTGSLFVGTYDFTGSSTIGGTLYSSTSAFSLKAYPAMLPGDQSSDFTVRLIGVSVQSQDPAKWLVVPANLTIDSMTYYHAGDVIVAADGSLAFTNSVFQLVQDYPNQRSITVDGTQALPGILSFTNSTVTSDKPIDLTVQGYGVLEATNTVFKGVNIIALEDAHIIFHNVTMDGNISTSWDSQATIDIFDSNLAQTMTLSGSAVGGFTNTSIPSVKVENSAVALIYRWIHVTVYDGAGFPCPDALVTASYFINGTFASSGISDSQGVARVKSTGTIIRATGSTFVGNYLVNASLTKHSVTFYAPEDISLGVMPYTEPLGRNATYATMTISGARPDLRISPTGVTVDPINPMNHQTTIVNATVTNIGAVPAHNVRADFYDEADNIKTPIGTATASIVPVDGSTVISVTWVADEPLDPTQHTISVVVDPLKAIPELTPMDLTASRTVTVQSLPDIEVRSDPQEIFTTPSYVIVNHTVTLSADIHNIGDKTTPDVAVIFYDVYPGKNDTIGATIVTGILPGYYGVASVSWTPQTSGTHTVYVVANGDGLVTEINYNNDNGSKSFTVLTPPDIELSGIQFNPPTNVPGGDTVYVTVTMRNTQTAPVSNVPVSLFLNAPTGTPVETVTPSDTLASNNAITVTLSYVTPNVESLTPLTLYVVANPDGTIEEISYVNNVQFGTVNLLDMRPDLAVTPSGITVKAGTQTWTNATFGNTVTVNVNVSNNGGRPANDFTVLVNLRNLTLPTGAYNHTLFQKEFSLSADTTNNTMTVSFSWTVTLTTPATYDLWVWVDSNRTVDESSDANNIAYVPFTITQLVPDITISVPKNEYTTGAEVVVTAVIKYSGTNTPIQNVPNVVFQLVDTSTKSVVVVGSQTVPTNSSNMGIAVSTMTIPTDMKSGSYDIVAVVLGQQYSSTPSAATLQISSQVSGGLFPWWVWIVIIVVVGAAIGGFTLYTYFYGLGKYVECGECGAFIPAASKRCPKCGVEFEAGTMKCSECGAWIPAESTECPNCGVKFVGEAEEEADYLERMRKEYDEMVSKYREMAKPELGKKFSDEAFEQWFKKQPGYISFDDWLAKEEEKKKEGPVPCPVCGTLNPKEATVCHKCGTVFGGTAETPTKKGPPPGAPPAAAVTPSGAQQAEQAPTETSAATSAAPRMVIRRPIEKKVVPKKIIRTPTGQVVEEEPKDENNQQ